mgnify:CR=1 FL=1
MWHINSVQSSTPNRFLIQQVEYLLTSTGIDMYNFVSRKCIINQYLQYWNILQLQGTIWCFLQTEGSHWCMLGHGISGTDLLNTQYIVSAIDALHKTNGALNLWCFSKAIKHTCKYTCSYSFCTIHPSGQSNFAVSALVYQTPSIELWDFKVVPLLWHPNPTQLSVLLYFWRP